MRLAITRRHIIRAAVFLAGAAAVAALAWVIVVDLGTQPGVGGRQREDREWTLGLLALGFAGLLAIPGAVLTVAFLQWPRTWLRRLYYTVLFLLVVANLLVFTTEAWRYAILFCLDCRLEAWWGQTIVPASVFVAVAPMVRAMLGPRVGLQADDVYREARVLRRVGESLLHQPAPGIRAPRTTMWLAAAPWLFWILARLMIADHGATVGNAMFVVLPGSYAAAFLLTLIATPLIGYRVFRDARQMSRMQKVWSLAGFAAGAACYAYVASAFGVIW